MGNFHISGSIKVGDFTIQGPIDLIGNFIGKSTSSNSMKYSSQYDYFTTEMQPLRNTMQAQCATHPGAKSTFIDHVVVTDPTGKTAIDAHSLGDFYQLGVNLQNILSAQGIDISGYILAHGYTYYCS